MCKYLLYCKLYYSHNFFFWQNSAIHCKDPYLWSWDYYCIIPTKQCARNIAPTDRGYRAVAAVAGFLVHAAAHQATPNLLTIPTLLLHNTDENRLTRGILMCFRQQGLSNTVLKCIDSRHTIDHVASIAILPVSGFGSTEITWKCIIFTLLHMYLCTYILWTDLRSSPRLSVAVTQHFVCRLYKFVSV